MPELFEASDGRIIVVQPVVPSYRLGLFARLASKIGRQFTVYASARDMGVLTDRLEQPAWERPLGSIKVIFPGLEWQSGAMGIPIRKNDIVVISGGPRCLSNLALMLKARTYGATTVWWGHYWSSTSARWRAAIRHALMRFSNFILFYTEHEITEFIEDGNARFVGRLFALNNGIETKQIESLRATYDAGTRPSDLLIIGRLMQKARIDVLINALARPECSRFKLEVIGSGDAEDDLRQRAHVLGVASRIHWHGGTTDEVKIAGIANQCKIFVYPGSVGLSIVHAMSYGLPAIVHGDRWKHMPEIAAFSNQVTGQSFVRDDEQSLANIICDMMMNHQRLNMMSEAAVATTKHSFNTCDMSERFCKMVVEIRKSRL
jgi:glycosyltransferase involved in cell wall biosynthesis